jgi:hypothetical protein
MLTFHELENYTHDEILEHIKDEWEATSEQLDGVKIIVAAVEDITGYEQSASFVFEKGGLLYLVNGSHCSCHGFEGQWEPDELALDYLHSKHFYLQGLNSEEEEQAKMYLREHYPVN